MALPTVIVTSPTTVPTPVDKIASSVTVITAADIESQQRRTVSDALATVPGLNVVQSGGPGGTTSIFMRGTASNHVKVMVDGIDFGDPSNPTGAADLSQLLTEDVERIEVLRGPQSGLYGSDAVGGVISITTRKGQGAAKARASLEGGSFGTFNQTAGVSGSKDKFNYAFNAAHLRSTSTPTVPWRFVAAGTDRVDNYYDNKTVSSRLGYDFNEYVSLNWVGRYTDSDYRYPTQYVPSIQDTQESHQFLTRGEAVVTLFDGRFKNFLGVNYTDLYRWITNNGTDPTTFRGERLKYDWRGVVDVMPGQTLVLGADKQTDTYKKDTNNFSAQNDNKGVYVELQSEFAERLFLVSNVRHDDNEQFGGHDTFRIAPAVLVPYTETKLKASYGTGFKAPSMDELYMDYPAWDWYGNPNLKPERSKGWDAGFEQPVAGDRFRFGATYFHNDITDLISWQTTYPPGYPWGYTTYYNISEAKTYGVEAFANWAVTARFRLRSDYTYTEAIDTLTDQQIARRPRHKGSVTATWTPTDRWQLSGTVLTVSEWFDTDRMTGAKLWTDGYTIVNIAAEFKANEQTTIFGRVDNLFDRHYENPSGFLKTGIGVFGGIRVANP